MKSPPPIIVFSDLDGTLLDAATYSCAGAAPALALLAGRGIPLVLCTSKTRGEVEAVRKLLDNGHPFVTENGGGIYVPDGYFAAGDLARHGAEAENGYRVVRLGKSYWELREELLRLRSAGFGVTGFGDLTAAEIAGLTGLEPDQARLAGEREFDEPFLFRGGEKDREALFRAIRERGLRVTEGDLLHLTGNHDKGRAVRILIELYRDRFGPVATIAVGDGPNDLPMLECVDYPAAVRKAGGHVHPALAGFPAAPGIGPEGWNRVVPRLLEQAESGR